MPNKVNAKKATAQRRFVEDVAQLLAPWGLPQTAARLYGHLLLAPEPVGLDRIAADLQVSKSTASVSVRVLEMSRLVRRSSQRGSRRVLFEVSDDLEGMVTEQTRLMQALARLLKTGARDAASGLVRERLEIMAEFNLATIEGMESALKRWLAKTHR
jgi:DNA-binding transcriptional regulator GbsR (MarR family)